MKKLTVILISLMLIGTVFASCGGNENTDVNEDTNEPVASTEETKASAEENAVSDKIINDEGEEFIVDTTVKGTIKEGASSIDNSNVVLCGKEYNFPIKISELIADGWYFPENQVIENDVDPESYARTNGIYLFDGNGSEITIGEVYNELTEAAAIEECYISDLSLNIAWEDITDFVLPGGIVAGSTAADVLSVFGNPNNADGFEWGYNLDDQLSYENNKTSGLTFHFTFNDDGTAYSHIISVAH